MNTKVYTLKLQRIFFLVVGSAAALLMTLSPLAASAAPWPEQYWFNRLSVEKAWQTTRGEGVVVAVIDTGVVDTNPSLRGQVLSGADFTGSGGDGRSDPGQSTGVNGFTYSHGTNMAALIAGRSDVDGQVGIAPDAKILPVKVFAATGQEAQNNNEVAEGIRYAVDKGADIINISIAGGTSCAPVVGEAVKYAYQKDVIVVAGAGNRVGSVQSPANCPGALGISASDNDFKPWSDTASGPEIAFTGTGVNVPQTTIEGNKLTGASGTSPATAITSGIFALIKAKYPNESARQIVARAIETAKTGLGKSGRISDLQGYGQVLPYQALTTSVAADAANPIYDKFDEELGLNAPQDTGNNSNGSSMADDTKKDEDSSTFPMVLAVAAALIVLGAIGALIAKSRIAKKSPEDTVIDKNIPNDTNSSDSTKTDL